MNFVDQHERWLRDLGVHVLDDVPEPQFQMPPPDVPNEVLPRQFQQWLASGLASRTEAFALLDGEPWFPSEGYWGDYLDAGMQVEFDEISELTRLGRFPHQPAVFASFTQDYEILIECLGPRRGWLYWIDWAEREETSGLPFGGPYATSISQHLEALRVLSTFGFFSPHTGNDFAVQQGINTRWPPDDTPGILLGFPHHSVGEERPSNGVPIADTFADLMPSFEWTTERVGRH